MAAVPAEVHPPSLSFFTTAARDGDRQRSWRGVGQQRRCCRGGFTQRRGRPCVGRTRRPCPGRRLTSSLRAADGDLDEEVLLQPHAASWSSTTAMSREESDVVVMGGGRRTEPEATSHPSLSSTVLRRVQQPSSSNMVAMQALSMVAVGPLSAPLYLPVIVHAFLC